MSNDILPYLLATAVIVAVGVGLIMLMGGLATRRRPLDTDWYKSQWHIIEKQLADGDSGRALAIVNADKLLDKAMKDLGYKGETMGERLKRYPGQFSDINAIWSAHKLRNRIAHEHGVSISAGEASRAIEQLKLGLKNLGAL